MSNRDLWEALYHRFDPWKPAEDAKWRADLPLSPADTICKALDRPFGIPRVLVTGTIGTGKTTELLHIAQSRVNKEFVVFLDLSRHFAEVVGEATAIERVSAWEVCFLAGLALLRAAEERLGFTFPAPHRAEFEQAWKALAIASQTTDKAPEVDVAKLTKTMVMFVSTTLASAALGPIGAAAGTGLSAVAEIVGTGKWQLPLGLAKQHVPDQDARVQYMLNCVNVLIGLVQARASKVLLIIDGLDRISQLERAKLLFLDSKLISQMNCRLVVCGPFVLRQQGVIANVQGYSDIVRPLVNVPVLSQTDPREHGPGIDFFCKLYARRVPEPRGSNLVSQPLLERMAYYSGGHVREFVGFIRRLAELAWDDDADTATQDHVKTLLDERRRLREAGLNAGHIRVLESVAADARHRFPENEMGLSLLINGSLLPYPDGNEWYYPHPLLTMSLVRVKTAGSSS